MRRLLLALGGLALVCAGVLFVLRPGIDQRSEWLRIGDWSAGVTRERELPPWIIALLGGFGAGLLAGVLGGGRR
jgi:uncharacterized membrane protein YfcA